MIIHVLALTIFILSVDRDSTGSREGGLPLREPLLNLFWCSCGFILLNKTNDSIGTTCIVYLLLEHHPYQTKRNHYQGQDKVRLFCRPIAIIFADIGQTVFLFVE